MLCGVRLFRMAISTVASAPITPVTDAPVRARPALSRSARLDVIAAAALGIAGITATTVVIAAIALP